MPLDREVIVDQIHRLYHSDVFEKEQKVKICHEIVHILLKDSLPDDSLKFFSVYAMISYLKQSLDWDRNTFRTLHRYRYDYQLWLREGGNAYDVLALGYEALRLVVKNKYDEHLKFLKSKVVWKTRDEKTTDFQESLFGRLALSVADEAIEFTSSDEDKKYLVVMDGLPNADNFVERLDRLLRMEKSGVPVNLIDVQVEGRSLRPAALALFPDFLVNITTIANSYSYEGASVTTSFIQDMLPMSSSTALLKGNVANYFFDHLIFDPESTFHDLLSGIFQLDELQYCLLSDDELKQEIGQYRFHYENLLEAITVEFPQHRILPEESFVEPSFMSAHYGLQGRLDLLVYGSQSKSTIVELKSAKPFRPNNYGINANHYVQTLLYDLLVKTTIAEFQKPKNYILYSSLSSEALRYAAPIKKVQYQALDERNKYVLLWHLAANFHEDRSVWKDIFSQLEKGAKQLKGYQANNYNTFKASLLSLNPTEKSYFLRFMAAVQREMFHAKMGYLEDGRVAGQSNMWRSTIVEKRESYNILNDVYISENRSASEVPLINFKPSGKTATLSNFRKGDTIVLYPVLEDRSHNPLQTQLYKGTLVELTPDHILVKLRARQQNQRFFERFDSWHIEHDFLDAGFTHAKRALFSWVQSPADRRELLLGKIAPKKSDVMEIPIPDSRLTVNQQQVLQEMVAAEDYYLLWGPPGTGKTSLLLRAYVMHFMAHSEDRLLLMAYTNRAVDEICEMLMTIDAVQENYIRIGSSNATGERFRHKLLSTIAASHQNRKGLKDRLEKARVVVGTLASIRGRKALFDLISFDRMVIDEASQILEYDLVGFLSKEIPFVLIGDHKQLPAISVLSDTEARIADKKLTDLGFTDARMSFFERLYTRCTSMGWESSIGILSEQGRMHETIMAFPSSEFYGDQLKILPGEAGQRQKSSVSILESLDVKYGQRILFHHIDSGDLSFSKSNPVEAQALVDVLSKIIAQYQETGQEILPTSIGIITPYRAQIAVIKHKIHQAGLSAYPISVDTVERYQGSARDIILVSFCVNALSQLRNLVSLSNGVDRKLNVTLTRARDHILLFGDKQILGQNKTYRKLIEEYSWKNSS